jgi:branched-chain amino acid transport system ATP-binding protein
MSYFESRKVTKYFGGLCANKDVSFDVYKGEIFGIVGPNGAGKTTFFNMISGVYAPSSGEILFKDEVISGLPPHEICKRKIGRTFQIPMSMDSMTVLDNVCVGAMVHTKKTREAKEYAEGILDFVGLYSRRNDLAGSFSVIQKKRLEIARALSTDPELLLLDEVMAGLHANERVDAMNLIRKIHDKGITVILIEHVMQIVMGICDNVLVLQNGMVIANATPAEISKDKAVISAYLGE